MQKQYVISSKHLIMPSLYRASITFTDRWTGRNLHRDGGLQITPLSVNVTLYFTDDREKCQFYSWFSCFMFCFVFSFPRTNEFLLKMERRGNQCGLLNHFNLFKIFFFLLQPLPCVRVDMIKISWRVWKLFTPWWSFINSYISPWFCCSDARFRL